MGKPYEKELRALHDTYMAACTLDIGRLLEFVERHRERPFIVVGSGGSLSLGALVQQLQEMFNCKISKAVTPLQLYELPSRIISDSVICFLSAGGSNPDILNAFDFALSNKARQLLTVTLAADSQLDKAARAIKQCTTIAFDSPAGKDGFLATNSLIYLAIAFIRAFGIAAGTAPKFADNLDEFLHSGRSRQEFENDLAEKIEGLASRTNLIAVYSTALWPAILDLESKLAEAALGALLPADWRNFAHGRHHWLARRGEEAGVIAFSTERDRTIAERTLKLLPDSIPVAALEIPGAFPESTLRGFLTVLHIVGLLGKAQGIDPGRPSVPLFGRKIYHLKYQPDVSHPTTQKHPCASAVERKSIALIARDREDNCDVIRKSLRDFLDKLGKAEIGGLALDYDGTICGARNRFGDLRIDLADELTRLARAGLNVGIATGRGKSVGEALRRSLPEEIWNQFTIGYYNGGRIQPLSAELSLDGDTVSKELMGFRELIQKELIWSEWLPMEMRPCQISILTTSVAQQASVFRQLQHLQSVHGINDLRLVYSTHSIDVLAPSVSKLNLVQALKEQLLEPGSEILCIGDLGMYPGNDFELLSEQNSLSVDEVSCDLHTCWNILPWSLSGEDGALCYLQNLIGSRRGVATFAHLNSESLLDCRKALRVAH